MFPINHLVPASEAGRRSWHLLLPPVLRRIPLSGCCFILPGWTRCCFLCALCPEELAPSLAHLVLPLVLRPAFGSSPCSALKMCVLCELHPAVFRWSSASLLLSAFHFRLPSSYFLPKFSINFLLP